MNKAKENDDIAYIKASLQHDQLNYSTIVAISLIVIFASSNFWI